MLGIYIDSHITESYYGFMIIVEQLKLASHYVSAIS